MDAHAPVSSPRQRGAINAILSALTLLACASALRAQNTFAFDPTGVYLDAEDILRSRKLAEGKELLALLNKAARDDEAKQLRYISLPRLFAEVRGHIDAKEPVPEDVKYLGGMVKLQYIFVRPDEKDLIIAGRCEPYDAKTTSRPLGLHTGRPVLQLDDLVVALRCTGPGHETTPIGCRIEMTAESTKKIMQTQAGMIELIKKFPDQRRKVAQAMAKAAGPQGVFFHNLEPDSRFAFVAVEADYLLKRLVAGLDPPPVKNVMTYLSTQTRPDSVSHRFWFEASYEPLLVSPDGLAFQVRGQSLRIDTRKQFDDKGDEPTPSAKQYAQHVTKHFDRLSQAIPAFADLANLSDLTLLAAVIGRDKLHEKAQWNLDWVLDVKGYPVEKVKVPRTAETIVNYSETPRMVLYIWGGVILQHDKTAANREIDKGATLTARNRGAGGAKWLTVEEK